MGVIKEQVVRVFLLSKKEKKEKREKKVKKKLQFSNP